MVDILCAGADMRYCVGNGVWQIDLWIELDGAGFVILAMENFADKLGVG